MKTDSSIQLAIEMKDAYAPYWGFSKWDLALGSTGALWPVAQYYNDDLKSINFLKSLNMKYFKSFALVIVLLGLWSCTEKESNAKEITLLVTTNVRGQLDPCG